MSSLSVPRRFRLGWYLAIAYLLLVAFASLAPFSGWRAPPAGLLAFLTAPRARWITAADVIINILAYMPFAFLVGVSLIGRMRPAPAALVAIAAGTLLSLTMETLQTMVPGRIASNLDLATNALGSALGAAAANVLHRKPAWTGQLIAWRDSALHAGRGVDLGIALLALLAFSHMNPSLPLMGSQVLEVRLPLSHPGAAMGFVAAETLMAGLNTLALALLLSLWLNRARHLPAVSTLACAALVAAMAGVKLAFALLLLKPAVLLQGISIEALIGAGYGLACGALFAHLAAPRRLVLAMAALAASAATAALLRDLPSPASLLGLFEWRHGHLHHFSELTRLVAALWPALTLFYAFTHRAALTSVHRDGHTADEWQAADRPPGRPR